MSLYIVGFGAGGAEQMTCEARSALDRCDLIVGYTVYTELLKKQFADKEYFSTPMTKEVERCEKALEEAEKDRNVAVVCSGDSGVYGMAALIFELSPQYPSVEIKVVAGVTAALGGAALLGAPLTNDFAVISLSDLLTPWEEIEKRLKYAAKGDFSICIYNPSSKKRADYLAKACDIMLKYKPPDTVCGIAVNIGRGGERCQIMSLKELRDTKVDMFTTAFIGSSHTREINGRMVTPRGYRL